MALFADFDCILAQNLSWFGYGLSMLRQQRRIAFGKFDGDDETSLSFGQNMPLVPVQLTHSLSEHWSMVRLLDDVEL